MPRRKKRAMGSAGADEPPEKSDRRGLLRFILVVALLAWAFRSFVFAPFSIPSGSMLPTLFIGDYVLVSKWPYGISRYSFPFNFPPIEGRLLGTLPQRGDVIVFRHPAQDLDMVKRVIARPGDRVEVRGGTVILDGKPVPRTRLRPFAMPVSANSPCRQVTPIGASSRKDALQGCLYNAFRETLPSGVSYTVLDQVKGSLADDFPVMTIPDGHLFLMGDNRDDSLDSRFEPIEGGVGLLPMERVIGRGETIVWSTDGSASYWKPWTWFTALRGDRIGNGMTQDGE